MKEEKYTLWNKYLSDKKIKFLPHPDYDTYTNLYHYTIPKRTTPLTDEQKLDKIELSVIEKYLRKKKLEKLNKI